MKQSKFSDLYCPFSSHINKYGDVLETYAIEWALRFNLLASESDYKHFSKLKGYLLATYTYPFCQLEELKIAADWINWLFIWDDQCDMSDLGKQPEVLKVFHKRFLELLNGSELTSNDIPIGHVLSDLRQRILQIGSAKSLNYFVRSVEDYFDGCEKEATNRAQGIIPNIDTYSIIRMLCGAVDSVIELVLLCNQIQLPDSLRENDIIKKLKLMTNRIIVLCNDIFSVSKEMANGDVTNIVFILHYQEKISLEEAIKRAAEMHNQEVKSMINLETSIPSFGEEVDAELAKYILGMHTWISGHLDWCFCTARFQNLEKLDLLKC